MSRDETSREFLLQRDLVTVTSPWIMEKIKMIRCGEDGKHYLGNRALILGNYRMRETWFFGIVSGWIVKKEENLETLSEMGLVDIYDREDDTVRNVDNALCTCGDGRQQQLTSMLVKEVVRSVQEAVEISESVGETETPDWQEIREVLTRLEDDRLEPIEQTRLAFQLNIKLGNCNFGDIPEDIQKNIVKIYGLPTIVRGRIQTRENTRLNYCEYTESYHRPTIMIKGVGWNEKSEWVSGLADGLIVGEEGGIILPGVLLAPQRKLLRLIQIAYFLLGIGEKIDELDIPTMQVGLVRPVKKDFDEMGIKVKGFITKK